LVLEWALGFFFRFSIGLVSVSVLGSFGEAPYILASSGFRCFVLVPVSGYFWNWNWNWNWSCIFIFIILFVLFGIGFGFDFVLVLGTVSVSVSISVVFCILVSLFYMLLLSCPISHLLGDGNGHYHLAFATPLTFVFTLVDKDGADLVITGRKELIVVDGGFWSRFPSPMMMVGIMLRMIGLE
jgi:hypothetical protein